MDNLVDLYQSDIGDDEGIDTESLTVLLVAGANWEDIAVALHVDLDAEPSDDDRRTESETSAYAFAEIVGGVLAIEHSGYADPSLDALRQITLNGGMAAVVRSNVQGRYRFGCARDGQVVFDENDYIFCENPGQVPSELRSLLDSVWVDLDADDDEDDADLDPFVVGLAMAETYTGLRFRSGDIKRAAAAGFRPAPARLY